MRGSTLLVASMRKPVLIGVAVAFTALLATSFWLWRDRAKVIRERDVLLWRFADGCNMIHGDYRTAEALAAELRDPRPTNVTSAQTQASQLAWRFLGLHYWLRQCAIDRDRASDLNVELHDALRHYKADDVHRLAGELRVLIPLRSERDRRYIDGIGIP